MTPRVFEPQQLFKVFKTAHGEAGVEIEESWNQLEEPETKAWEAVADFVNLSS